MHPTQQSVHPSGQTSASRIPGYYVQDVVSGAIEWGISRRLYPAPNYPYANNVSYAGDRRLNTIMWEKTVLITGASAGGIGDRLAQEFHSGGLHVFATARSLDVTSKESIDEAVANVGELAGRSLDFLVNNAGVGQYWSFIHIFLLQ